MKKNIEKIINKLEFFLSSKISNGRFPQDNNYGELFFAAYTKDSIKKEIFKKYLYKNKNSQNFHWEFNNYILQQMNLNDSKFQIYKFNQIFIKKVTNWILLRSLIYLRSKNKLYKIKGNLMAKIILLINQKKGFLTDNRIYRKKEFSSQYHAFATAILGEIYLETKNKCFKASFVKAIKILLEITFSKEKFHKGRGSSQIFGYSSAIYALLLGEIITSKNYSKNIAFLVNELKKFQRKDGSIPLCLNSSEFKLNQNDYKKFKNKITGWESYSRYYDYLGFTYYFLNKSIKLMKTSKNIY